jgi:hypothetical protein
VVQSHTQVSQFARNYARRRELAVRALQWKQLYDPVLPGIFITWAKRTQIEFPPELDALVAANGHVIGDWKSLYDALTALAQATQFEVLLSAHVVQPGDALDHKHNSLVAGTAQAVLTNSLKVDETSFKRNQEKTITPRSGLQWRPIGLGKRSSWASHERCRARRGVGGTSCILATAHSGARMNSKTWAWTAFPKPVLGPVSSHRLLRAAFPECADSND